MAADDRRAQLIAAARDAFIAEGYRGATTAGIAQRCGVSESLVIKYFGAKEDLFREALVDPLLAALRDRVAENRAVLARGELGSVQVGTATSVEFLERWVGLLRREGQALLALLQDLREVPDAARQLIEMLHHDLDELAQSLAAFLEAPEYRAVNARMLAVSSLATAAAAAFLEDDPSAFLDDYIDLVAFGLVRR